MFLRHGGQLLSVAKQYNIPAEQWLDLSTGIAPYHYPIPSIPSSVWAQLPQTHATLLASAEKYYKCPALLPVSGSQSVIQRLPQLYLYNNPWLAAQSERISVYLPVQGYKEHEKAWRKTGVNIIYYHDIPSMQQLNGQCVVVLINPNNPAGKLISKVQVLALLQAVKRRQGLLIVDEAFMDTVQTDQSVIADAQCENLIVLRSVGKFFGLAGLRLGFAAACDEWLAAIAADQGPWPVSGPAQYVGHKALSDSAWQQQQRLRLRSLSLRLSQLLKSVFNVQSKGTALFQTIRLANAENIYDKLCRQAVYVRLTDDEKALRFGIPAENNFSRLKKALQNI
ncbi:threonine-phosphate decarboxylase CobD [Marinagarivorans cellulosilyticus]|uniref:threonine-phosphate decarboxylase n=1 Tax=Marinagarivorans cellulosilyticus TaxID=2721545 RepID=A0AAN1WH13_9GAMM|nr:threonine-phosphate decarboxylase CobD [Marinagarivorans cellulosilyticus]BCD97451.1 cobalamin biosynthetic protein CobC [Marinagarivorans cellulosilyticus]